MLNFHPPEDSLDTAKIVLPVFIDLLKAKSLLDLGCNRGRWCEVATEYGLLAIGIDGDNMRELWKGEEDSLIIENLCDPIDLERKFDLVICLEVGEHLPEESADNLISTCCRHSDNVLWSAATPGQGGYNHINEQYHSYWVEKFNDLGYDSEDWSEKFKKLPHDYYRKNLLFFKKRKTVKVK